MKQMINIGVEKQTVVELRKTIMDILKLNRGDDVTLKALDVLSTRIAHLQQVKNGHYNNED